jgi:hypothetical protein
MMSNFQPDLNPHLVPPIRYGLSRNNEPTGWLLGAFWPEQLRLDDVDADSLGQLRDDVRLDKFLSIVNQSPSFSMNSIVPKEKMRRQIFAWLYFRTIEFGCGDFSAGYEPALPLLWEVLPNLHEGPVLIRATASVVDKCGHNIWGILQTWSFDAENQTGTITLRGRPDRFAFTWADVQRGLIGIPDWQNLLQDLQVVGLAVMRSKPEEIGAFLTIPLQTTPSHYYTALGISSVSSTEPVC